MPRPAAILFRGLTAAGIACALITAGIVSAQGPPPLAEVARKEAERRTAQPSARKVSTSKDLPASAHRPAGPPMPAPTQAVLPPDAPAEQKPAEEDRNEAWWKARIAAAREEVRRNEAFAEALQSRINALGRDFVNRDNPIQRARISEQRAEALDELARVKLELDRGKKTIEDIEEDARKAGVPPGWLR